MNKDIFFYIKNVDKEANFSNIDEFERFEERFFEIEKTFGDIVGMGVGYVEFCPNYNPPDIKKEILPWLWLIYPQLKNEIVKLANDDLKKLIEDYENDSDVN